METRILSILTRTPLHVGSGASVGAIDLPIQRERHTQIPIIPGSSLKGVLRDLWSDDPTEQVRLFGPESNADEHRAGELLVGEARVLLFPVRSAQGSFAWITCPLALRRFLRDLPGQGKLPPPVDELKDGTALAGSGVLVSGKRAVVLEEYSLNAKDLPGEVPALLSPLQPADGDDLLSTISRRLVVVSDGVFSYFCANACEVQQRVRIDDQTHTVAEGALFNQENVPSDTLFYAVLGVRSKAADLDTVSQKLASAGGVIQIGGDETVGLGFCSVRLAGGGR